MNESSSSRDDDELNFVRLTEEYFDKEEKRDSKGSRVMPKNTAEFEKLLLPTRNTVTTPSDFKKKIEDHSVISKTT
jgi:hypothetical protein